MPNSPESLPSDGERMEGRKREERQSSSGNGARSQLLCGTHLPTINSEVPSGQQRRSRPLVRQTIHKILSTIRGRFGNSALDAPFFHLESLRTNANGTISGKQYEHSRTSNPDSRNAIVSPTHTRVVFFFEGCTVCQRSHKRAMGRSVLLTM